MTTTNSLSAVIAMLRANAAVAAAVGNITVYGQSVVAVTGEIDDEWAKHMPRRMILVIETGGLSKDTISPLGYPRLDVRCYNTSVWEASELSRKVYEQLQAHSDLNSGIVSVTLSGGPTGGREPDTEWAYNLRIYDILGEG